MGKRGKRRRRSGNAKREATDNISESGVSVTTNDDFEIVAWKANVFLTPSSDEHAVDLQQQWKTLEQRKRRTLTPTPIQLHVWPVLMSSNKSVVGIAPTGSGKTLAFGLPLTSQHHAGNALVLVPTRELARQVERELSSVSNKTIMCIYGGVDRSSQVSALTEAMNGDKPWIVAATTGRLVDILEEETLSQFAVESVVLDEADRMASNVDMARQVDEILQRLKPRNESVRVSLFSATSPSSVQDKWKEWTGESRVCIKVNTITVGEKSVCEEEVKAHETQTTEPASATAHETKELDFSKIPAHVNQILHVCAAHKKPRKLMTTLQKIRKDEGRRKGLCLVFFGRIKTLQYVHKLLDQEGYKAAEFHSQLPQSVREKTLMNFKSGKVPTLLSTDIASRGIHVNNIEYVISYDFPGSLDQYIHRCGRAGRGHSSGSSPTAYSFFTRDFAPMAKDVLALLESSNAWIDPNLVALVGTEGPAKKRPRKQQRSEQRQTNANNADGKGKASGKVSKVNGSEANGDEDTNGDDDWDDGQFANLNANRIVLQRAGHVSEASDSDDGSSS